MNFLEFFQAYGELETLTALCAMNNPGNGNVHELVKMELSYLDLIGISKPDIYNCAPLSIITCIKSAMRKNLTLDPEAGLVYIKVATVKSKDQQGRDLNVKVLEVKETANGLISYNRMLGNILDITQPAITYNGVQQVVEIRIDLLKPSFPNPRWESRTFNITDFTRWAGFSHRQNGRSKNDADINTLNYANALYRSHNGWIDPGFASAKAVRHALNKLGTNRNEDRKVQFVNTGNLIPLGDALKEADEELQSYQQIS